MHQAHKPSILTSWGLHGRWLADQLGRLKHPEGQPVACLYGVYRAMQEAERKEDEEDFSVPMGAVDQGPVVTFNLLRPDGSFVGFRWPLQQLPSLEAFWLALVCVAVSEGDERSQENVSRPCWGSAQSD